MMILAALLVLGGDSLADFALALLLGIIVGTCSTVSISAPLAVELESRRTRHLRCRSGPLRSVPVTARWSEQRPGGGSCSRSLLLTCWSPACSRCCPRAATEWRSWWRRCCPPPRWPGG
ncbi:MAG: hypothetical protein ACRDL4_01905 [Thermoleophilaceae bacterium]